MNRIDRYIEAAQGLMHIPVILIVVSLLLYLMPQAQSKPKYQTTCDNPRICTNQCYDCGLCDAKDHCDNDRCARDGKR